MRGGHEEHGVRGVHEEHGVRGVHEEHGVRGVHEDHGVRGMHEDHGVHEDQGSHGVQGDQPGRPRRMGLLLAVAAGIFATDLATKTIVVATLSDRQPVRLLGGLLTLRVLRNSGAAFSIGTSMTVVFTLIAVAVIISILRTSRRLRSLPWAVTLGLLLGGATGNLGDRLFRYPGPLRGYVVDWIELPHWPVFNVADSAIVCGGILAVLLAARGIRLDGTRDRTRRSPGDGSGDITGNGPGDGPRQRTPDGTLARDRPAPGPAAGGSTT